MGTKDRARVESIESAAVRIAGDWYRLDPEDLVEGKATFLEGADQCDTCGYPLDGLDDDPREVKVQVQEAVGVLVARIECQCGRSYSVDVRFARRS